MTAILATFESDRRSLSVADIVEWTGIPRATVHRMANKRAEDRWLERDGTKFVLGLRTFELGHRVPLQRQLREAATPYMSDIRAATGQTVNLAVLDGRDVVYVELLRGRNAPPILRKAQVGGRLPAHTTGLGKALLAFSGREMIEAYLAQPLERFGPRTIQDPNVLRAELEQARSEGVAYDREEAAEGVLCAACPIFRRKGGALAASVSVSGWTHGMALDKTVLAVQTTAMAVSRALGA